MFPFAFDQMHMKYSVKENANFHSRTIKLKQSTQVAAAETS